MLWTSARFFGGDGLVGMAPWLLPYMVPITLGGVVSVPTWSFFTFKKKLNRIYMEDYKNKDTPYFIIGFILWACFKLFV
jgi:hypothetical protein